MESSTQTITLTVSDIKQYVYCPRVVYFSYFLPLRRPTTYKMEEGKLEHEHLADLEARRSLKAYGLAEGERRFNLNLYSRRLELTGRLDMIITTATEVIPVDFKNTGGPAGLNHKYQLTGYALVMESLYEYPINVGCVVYPSFPEGRFAVERDFHLIDDELRQWFIEERDERMRMLHEEIDPGVASECQETCPFWRHCHPE